MRLLAAGALERAGRKRRFLLGRPVLLRLAFWRQDEKNGHIHDISTGRAGDEENARALKGVMAVVAGKKGPRGCLAAHACHGGGKGKAAGRSGRVVGAVTAAKQGANARGLLQGERSR